MAALPRPLESQEHAAAGPVAALQPGQPRRSGRRTGNRARRKRPLPNATEDDGLPFVPSARRRREVDDGSSTSGAAVPRASVQVVGGPTPPRPPASVVEPPTIPRRVCSGARTAASVAARDEYETAAAAADALLSLSPPPVANPDPITAADHASPSLLGGSVAAAGPSVATDLDMCNALIDSSELHGAVVREAIRHLKHLRALSAQEARRADAAEELAHRLAGELEKAREELERAHSENRRHAGELDKALVELERSRSDNCCSAGELKKAREELERSQSENRRQARELDKALVELELSRSDNCCYVRELENAREELERSQSEKCHQAGELESTRTELESFRSETRRQADALQEWTRINSGSQPKLPSTSDTIQSPNKSQEILQVQRISCHGTTQGHGEEISSDICKTKCCTSSSNISTIDPGSHVMRKKVGADATRDWSELPQYALTLVFGKLDAIEILMGSGLVCCSWLAAAKLPDLWRSVDMAHHMLIYKVAVDRSGGQMEKFVAMEFVTDELLNYIGDRSPALKTLGLISCDKVSNKGFTQLIAKCPMLEGLKLVNCDSVGGRDVYEAIGMACPRLKHFTLREASRPFRRGQVGRGEVWCEGVRLREVWPGEVLGVAAMHKLRSLTLFNSDVTNDELLAILDSCPHLELLDMCGCSNIVDTTALRVRCAAMKSLKFCYNYNATMMIVNSTMIVVIGSPIELSLFVDDWSTVL